MEEITYVGEHTTVQLVVEKDQVIYRLVVLYLREKRELLAVDIRMGITWSPPPLNFVQGDGISLCRGF